MKITATATTAAGEQFETSTTSPTPGNDDQKRSAAMTGVMQNLQAVLNTVMQHQGVVTEVTVTVE